MYAMRMKLFSVLAASLAMSCGTIAQQTRQNANQTAGQGTGQAQTQPAKQQPRIRPNDAGVPVPARADILRGAYGPYRENNKLLYYHLDIRLDPEKKYISGKNTIRFRMLKADDRIQLDLTGKLNIDKILYAGTLLKYERDGSAVFVNFPSTLPA